MKGWRKTTLGNVIHIKHGFAFKGKYFVNEPTQNILLTPGNFAIGGGFKGDKLKYYDGPVPEDYILSEGDVLVTMTDLSKKADTLGFSAKVPASSSLRYLHNQRLGYVSVLDDSFDLGYLYWLMRTPFYQHFVAGSASGSTVKHTSPKKIYAYGFKYPPLPTQKKIARLLSRYDDLIENNLRRIGLLEELARETYREWFVRGRFPGWERASNKLVPRIFSDVVQVKPRTSVKAGTIAPYVPMGSLATNGMTIDPIDERAVKGGTKFKNGDTLFARITPCLENGKTGFVQFMDDDQVATGSTEFIVFRETELCGRYFIYCLSRSDEFRGIAIKSMVGSDGRQRVNTDCFDGLEILISTPEVMMKFEDTTGPMFQLIRKLVVENQSLREVRDLLLPRLMAGVVDLDKLNEV